ncbi:MAG: GTP-binding protein [Hespellia sp.]|nr:GTP-binding protein [Hespellia sp.]
MDEYEVMVYLMTGFLESGKSSFLKFTLAQDYFQIDGTTLLILCEQGEEEFDAKTLKKNGVVIETVKNQDEINEAYFKAMDARYDPERVIIEWNGMWKVSDMEQTALPKGWGITQKLTTVDASTFQVYMQALKPLFVEMVKGADLVLFNRCKDIEPLAGYRRSVKVVSPQAEVVFEDEKGEIENIFGDSVPYDMNAPVIQIANEDYGIWYVDVMENPDRYKGRKVEIIAKAKQPLGFPARYIQAGRRAMTCCADDVQYIGYVGRLPEHVTVEKDSWLKIRAVIGFKHLSVYRGRGPVLEIESVEKTEPVEELVYFN